MLKIYNTDIETNEFRELKEFKKEQAQKESQKLFYVKDLVELYLSQYIEDHYSENGRLIVVPPIPDRQYPGYVRRQNRNQWYRYIKAPVLR